MSVQLTGDLWNGVLERTIATAEARVMVRVAKVMEQKVVRFTPKDQGELQGGYVIGSKVEPTAVTVTLGNRAPHTLDVAHGTRPHNPRRSAIEGWVRRNIDKRKKNLTKRKRWYKAKLREERAQRTRRRGRKTEAEKAQERERMIKAVTTMTVKAIRRSGTQARRMGRKAAEIGRKIAGREQRKALREAVRRSRAA